MCNMLKHLHKYNLHKYNLENPALLGLRGKVLVAGGLQGWLL